MPSRFALMILMAPTGGKSTLTNNLPQHCADIERDLFFRRLRRIGRLCDDGPNWESTMDMHYGFMDVIALSCLAHVHIGNLAPVNVVNPHNAAIVGLFAKGIRESGVFEAAGNDAATLDIVVERALHFNDSTVDGEIEGDPSVGCVIGVIDRQTVDVRMHEREDYAVGVWGYGHMGYAWTQSCHILLDGIATRYGIPRVPSASLLQIGKDLAERCPREDLFADSVDAWFASGYRTFVFHCNVRDLSDTRWLAGAPSLEDAEDALIVRYALVSFLPCTWALYAAVIARDGKRLSSGEVALEALYTQQVSECPPLMEPEAAEFRIELKRKALSRPVHWRDGVGHRIVIRRNGSVAISESAPSDDMTVPIEAEEHTFATTMSPVQWTANARTYLPTYNVSAPVPGAKNVLLLYYGSFAPFHAGHLETLCLAKRHMETAGCNVIGALVAPVPSTYPKTSNLECLEPYRVRAVIAAMVCRHLPWVAVDRIPENGTETYVSQVVSRVLEHLGAGVKVIWINGTDIPVTRAMERFVRGNTADLLFVPRVGETMEEDHRPTTWTTSGQDVTPEEAARLHYCAEKPRLSLSSTFIRQLVLSRDFVAAERCVGNAAAASFLFSTHYLQHERRQSAEAYSAAVGSPVAVLRSTVDDGNAGLSTADPTPCTSKCLVA